MRWFFFYIFDAIFTPIVAQRKLVLKFGKKNLKIRKHLPNLKIATTLNGTKHFRTSRLQTVNVVAERGYFKWIRNE